MSTAMLSDTNLSAAIERGVAYLSHTQKVTGEFETVTSPYDDMHEVQAYPKSVYTTTFVMHGLASLEKTPQIEQMRERAAAFLRQEQGENGAWNYEGKGNWRVPSDLDDTACAIAALAQLGQRPELSFYALLWQNESAPGGPYYTWLGVNELEDDIRARQVDALVNANIVYCCGLLNLSLPKTVYYLEQVIHAEAYEQESLYILSPHFLIYALSRAYADGGVRILDKAMSVMADYVLSQLPSPQVETSIFNLACLAVSLSNMQTPFTLIRPYLMPLLMAQQDDGSWPACPAYAGFSPNYDGSIALTTTLAIEALHKYYIA